MSPVIAVVPVPLLLFLLLSQFFLLYFLLLLYLLLLLLTEIGLVTSQLHYKFSSTLVVILFQHLPQSNQSTLLLDTLLIDSFFYLVDIQLPEVLLDCFARGSDSFNSQVVYRIVVVRLSDFFQAFPLCLEFFC